MPWQSSPADGTCNPEREKRKKEVNTFLDGGSGSSYLKEEIADVLGLEAESRPLRVSVFGVQSIVMDSKTVTAQPESIDRGAKRDILLWTTLNI